MSALADYHDLQHNTRRMLQALDCYWMHWDGYTPKRHYKHPWPRGKYETEDWWNRYEKYRKLVEEAL